MSDETNIRSGQITVTPEGGPLAGGMPATTPGAGQVRLTPEAGPLTPPTLRDHMQGPILGLDDATTLLSPAAVGEGLGVRESVGEEPEVRATAAEEQPHPPPRYIGKPVSEVRWDALRYAAPLVSQAEKLTIRAIDLTGRGLSRLARILEERRTARDSSHDRHTG